MDFNLMTIADFCRSQTTFTDATIRNWRARKKHPMNNIFTCIGNRIYVDLDKFNTAINKAKQGETHG